MFENVIGLIKGGHIKDVRYAKVVETNTSLWAFIRKTPVAVTPFRAIIDLQYYLIHTILVCPRAQAEA